MTPGLVLRDVHPGQAPSLWPPAPGWWLVAAVLLLAIGWVLWRRHRRKRRHALILRYFDGELAGALTPPQQIAAMSQLLRRAARQHDPAAVSLEGEAWLRFLDDGMQQPVFAAGAGALLRDGGFRNDVSVQEAEALRGIARQRYLSWMGGA